VPRFPGCQSHEGPARLLLTWQLHCRNSNTYPSGISVSDADMKTLYLETDAFHGEWNYTLRPRLTLPSE
jgi:hypothetical protein